MLPNLAGDLWFTRLTWKRKTANKTRTEDLKINPEYLEKEGSKKVRIITGTLDYTIHETVTISHKDFRIVPQTY